VIRTLGCHAYHAFKGPVFLELVICFDIFPGLRYRQKLSIYCNIVISYARHLVVIAICFSVLVPYGLFQSLGTVGEPVAGHRFVEINCECGWGTIVYHREQ